MKVLLDVNLPPSLAAALASDRLEVVHWTAVGSAMAPDAEILGWAQAHGYVVVTQDLDHAEILATTGASAPSVVVVRDADVLGADLPRLLRDALEQCAADLESGAIVALDARGRRVRVLPIA